jgi:dihydrodipicolinate synthase/N-acetylneuraminate lyase
MLTTARGQVRVLSGFLVSIGLLALVALAIAFGVHAFLAAVGHYAPWEQIWAG